MHSGNIQTCTLVYCCTHVDNGVNTLRSGCVNCQMSVISLYNHFISLFIRNCCIFFIFIHTERFKYLLYLYFLHCICTLCVLHCLGAWPNCSCREAEIIRTVLQPVILSLLDQRWDDLPSSGMSHIETLCYLLSQCSSTSPLPDAACYM